MIDYSVPTAEQVREALRRTVRPELRRAFFEELQNPNWLEPLWHEGVFANAPEPVAGEDGLLRDMYWAPLTYLMKVAALEPSKVVEILLSLRESRNSWVRRTVFAVGRVVPADDGRRLVPMVVNWGEAGLGWRSDPREMVDFTIRLLEAGQVSAGRRMANILFRPTDGATAKSVEVGLEEYWYEAELPRLAAALGEDGLAVVMPWLNEYERLVGHVAADLDLTSLTRASIRTRSGHARAPSIEQALVDAVRDLAVRRSLTEPERAVALLLRTESTLNRKIALFALHEALSDDELGEEVRSSAVTVAKRLLEDPRSSTHDTQIEYAELVRSTPDSMAAFAAVLNRGPDVDLDRVRTFASQTDKDPERAVAEYVERWRHRWLACVGADRLDDALTDELRLLDERHGRIEKPLEPADEVVSWVGPTSARGVDELDEMTGPELVDFLATWHPRPDRFGPEPSHEGQGRELTALLTGRPAALGDLATVVERLRPTYISAALRGWEGALRASIPLPWDGVVAVIRDVLRHPDTSTFEPEGRDFDDEPDYHGAKRTAIRLLVELVKPRRDPAPPPDELRECAALLLRAENDRAWEAYNAGFKGEGSDPLTLSLNWQWPERFRGLVYLLAHGAETSWYYSAVAEVEKELSRSDRRGASSAVLGESLGRLMAANVPWLEDNFSRLFGGRGTFDENKQRALTTALAVYGYNRPMFEHAREALFEAMRAPQPLAVGWSGAADPLQRVGEWIICALIVGHIPSDDDLVQAFFSDVEPSVRGQALGRVGWSMADEKSEIDVQILQRFSNLWDARIEHVRAHPKDAAELDEFFWVVRSGRFPEQWWMSRFLECLQLDPALKGERYMVGAQIARAAKTDPRRALAITKALIGSAQDRALGALELSRYALPIVIARALDSGDAALRDEARVFMSEVGEQGNPELESEVEKVRRGDIDNEALDD